MDRSTINTLGLCAGVGMLDLGVATALEWLGFRPRAAALCEWESYAASVLLARMEDATMEPCPIWCGDLRDFDAQPFRGVVDVLAAGLPCQPYSVAGKQLGNVDHRSHGEDGAGPIPQFLRIVEECRPTVVFCENVPPWIRGGFFRPVGEELSRMGYTIEDPLFITAESVGASHKRERVFVLAHNSLARSWAIPKSNRRDNATNANGCIDELAVANGSRWSTAGSGLGEHPRSESESRRGDVADAKRHGLGVSGRTPAIEPDQRHDRPLFAPGPNANWAAIPEHLWPATQPGFRVVVDGMPMVVDASRADQFRCAGNGCVPLVAAVAFVELFQRVKQA